jgi:hypothetical protein
MMDLFQKFVKCAQFVRKSVRPPKIIHASDFVHDIINPCTAVWGMILHSLCNVVVLKSVKEIYNMLLIVHQNQGRNLLLNGQE